MRLRLGNYFPDSRHYPDNVFLYPIWTRWETIQSHDSDVQHYTYFRDRFILINEYRTFGSVYQRSIHMRSWMPIQTGISVNDVKVWLTKLEESMVLSVI